MHSLPRNLGLLGGIVAFCAALLLGLLQDYPPLMATRKAAICAVALALVAWLCTRIAIGVMRDGMRQYSRENGE